MKEGRGMKNILEHCIIVLSITFLAFLLLDHYNAQMNFSGNSLSRKMLLVFCVFSIVNCTRQIVLNRKR